MADGETRIITQPEGEAFDLRHHGGLALHGQAKLDPLRHRHDGEIAHGSDPDRPLVHMVLWGEDGACEVNGRVVLRGDPEQPVQVAMRHAFPDEHRQSHAVRTGLADPIHHALQMRTPLQVRFCNPWHIASDYTLEINLGRSRVISVRLTGATIAKPQPCDGEEPCPPPVVTAPVHP
jgi:hypothetical protein